MGGAEILLHSFLTSEIDKLYYHLHVPTPLFPENTPVQLDRRLKAPDRSGRFGETKNLFLLQEIKPRFLGYSITIQSELSRLTPCVITGVLISP